MALKMGPVVLIAFLVGRLADGSGGHDWEWAGAFTVVGGRTYTWSAERGESGDYADPTMKLVIIPMNAGQDIEAVEAQAHTIWDNAQWTKVTTGDILSYTSAGNGYSLEFHDETWSSFFYITPSSSGNIAFFAEHFPTEFEQHFHYFKDKHGTDIEPFAQEPDDASVSEAKTVKKKGSLGMAVGGAILTALPGLICIVCVGPMVKRCNQSIFPVMNSFAAGAILACAVFLLLPEGLHLAGAGQDEVTGAWTWGTGIMVGWLLCVFIHVVSDFLQGGRDSEAKVNEAIEAKEESSTPAKTDISVAGPVLVGDFFHNLVDGMVIGFSVKSCSSSAAWGVIAATIAHEAPQEVADFIVLLTKANMGWILATVLNSMSAFGGVIIGALIAYETEINANLEGILLAFGGGVYLFVAVTELSPYLLKPGPLTDVLMRVAAFVFGTVILGLVLIGHEHCSAEPVDGEAAADPHAGHNHR